ncbi:Aspartate racemase [subsurface metagenome]
MPERVVGILGGMGPEATVDFFAKVIARTPAKRDQDHLRIIIDNNPKIPDRTEAILTKDKSLFPMLVETAKNLEMLVETAKNLEKAGADFIVIPCNTVHYFYEDLVREISIPILHMIREVTHAVKASLPECQRVGLLATSGTITANLYQTEFQKIGVEVIVPDSEYQTKVMDAIQAIKSGGGKDRAREELTKVADLLIQQGKAQALILGCTDIPVVIRTNDFSVPLFDSNLVLARATVKFAKLQ